MTTSEGKHGEHVVQFDEDAEVIENENCVEERHATLVGETEKRCFLETVHPRKQNRINSVKLICTPTKSRQSQQRILDTQKQIS